MDNNITRRSTLRGIAAGTALVGGVGTGIGAAGETSADDPCAKCGALLTKYEWEDDQFVFEKGRDSLGIDGDEFVLDVTTDAEGEPTEVCFDSIDNADGQGIYEATCATVKAGQEIDTFDLGSDPEWVSNGCITSPNDKAISNFALCINDAMWQLDFGTGAPPLLNTEDPATREGYGNDGRNLIAAAVYGPPNRVENYSFTGSVSGVDLVSTEFDLEDEGGNDVSVGSGDAASAAVTFEVTASEALELHLGSWEMPGPFSKADIPWGPRYDMVHDWFDPGEHTITANLPTL